MPLCTTDTSQLIINGDGTTFCTKDQNKTCYNFGLDYAMFISNKISVCSKKGWGNLVELCFDVKTKQIDKDQAM